MRSDVSDVELNERGLEEKWKPLPAGSKGAANQID